MPEIIFKNVNKMIIFPACNIYHALPAGSYIDYIKYQYLVKRIVRF